MMVSPAYDVCNVLNFPSVLAQIGRLRSHGSACEERPLQLLLMGGSPRLATL